MSFITPLLIFLFVILLTTAVYAFVRWRVLNDMLKAQQTIWSVTGPMNHENSTDNQRWPTHNSNVSVDSFIMTESARMQQKDRVPPPAYSEIDLPSYEQAVCMNVPKSTSNTPAVHAASSSSTTNQDPRPS